MSNLLKNTNSQNNQNNMWVAHAIYYKWLFLAKAACHQTCSSLNKHVKDCLALAQSNQPAAQLEQQLDDDASDKHHFLKKKYFIAETELRPHIRDQKGKRFSSLIVFLADWAVLTYVLSLFIGESIGENQTIGSLVAAVAASGCAMAVVRQGNIIGGIYFKHQKYRSDEKYRSDSNRYLISDTYAKVLGPVSNARAIVICYYCMFLVVPTAIFLMSWRGDNKMSSLIGGISVGLISLFVGGASFWNGYAFANPAKQYLETINSQMKNAYKEWQNSPIVKRELVNHNLTEAYAMLKQGPDAALTTWNGEMEKCFHELLKNADSFPNLTPNQIIKWSEVSPPLFNFIEIDASHFYLYNIKKQELEFPTITTYGGPSIDENDDEREIE